MATNPATPRLNPVVPLVLWTMLTAAPIVVYLALVHGRELPAQVPTVVAAGPTVMLLMSLVLRLFLLPRLPLTGRFPAMVAGLAMAEGGAVVGMMLLPPLAPAFLGAALGVMVAWAPWFLPRLR